MCANDISKDPPYDIVPCFIAIGPIFKNQFNNPNIFICGILPSDECFVMNRLFFNEINDLLKFKCSVKSYHYVNQSNGWLVKNGILYSPFFFADGLYLDEKGNLKLAKSIFKAIDSIITIPRFTNPYKNEVCLKLSEGYLPFLSLPAIRCKSICSPVKSVSLVCKLIPCVFKPFVKVIAIYVHLPYLFVLHPSRCLRAHCINLLLPLYLGIPTATFFSHIPNICSIDSLI